jgi:hypothetical protein
MEKETGPAIRQLSLSPGGKQIMEEFKKNIQSVLTPDQTPIFQEIVTHFQVEPGKFGLNFSY